MFAIAMVFSVQLPAIEYTILRLISTLIAFGIEHTTEWSMESENESRFIKVVKIHTINVKYNRPTDRERQVPYQLTVCSFFSFDATHIFKLYPFISDLYFILDAEKGQENKSHSPFVSLIWELGSLINLL